MKLKGMLSITRRRLDEGFVMEMELVDKMSGSHFLQVDISPENLLLAITTFADQECEFELGACEYIGKQQEVKRLRIPGIQLKWNGVRCQSKEEFARDFAEAVKPYEVDGWEADKWEGYNDRRQSKEGYEVVFRRYIGEGLGYKRVSEA